MGPDIDYGLKFPEQFLRASADAIVVYFRGFQYLIRIDDETAPERQADVLNVALFGKTAKKYPIF